MEWYGGGPDFERILVYGVDGRKSVELYPPMFYAMMTKEDGTPNNSEIISCLASNRFKMGYVGEILKKKFSKEKEESRIWYRLMATSNWKQCLNKEDTVEDIGLSYGDKLLLEIKLKSKLLLPYAISRWLAKRKNSQR